MTTTIVQTNYSTGIETPPQSFTAGAVTTRLFTLDLGTTGLAADAIVEIGVLPPFARIREAVLIPEGTFETGSGPATPTTCTVGIMSGDVGSTSASRTCGGELFAAGTAMTATVRNTLAAGFKIDPVDYARSIGIACSAAVAAATSKRISLQVDFYQ